VALSLRTALLGGGGKLVALDPDPEAPLEETAIPGLAEQPLGAETSRVYVEIGGTLTAISLSTGRVAWRTTHTGRVTHLDTSGRTLLATVADGSIACLAKADGRPLWRAELGAAGTSAPLTCGGRVVVTTRSGEALVFAVEEGPPAPVASPAPTPATRTFHSPDGYSVAVPPGWATALGVLADDVSLGLQPASGADRYRRTDVPELAHREFLLRCQLTVRVVPSANESDSDLGLLYLTEEQLRARAAGYRVSSPEIVKQTHGDRTWTEVRMQAILPSLDGRAPCEKRAVVGRLDEARAIWIELLAPLTYREKTLEDFGRLVASFTPEPEGAWETPPEVLSAADFLAALEAGDIDAAAPCLSEPLRHRFADGLPDPDGFTYRILERSSEPHGAFRRIPVLRKGPGGPRVVHLTMGREGDAWVVMDWRGLFE
jgi:hypothetical protein